MRSAANSKCPKNLSSRAATPHNVQLRIIGAADVDSMAGGVLAGPVGLGDEADAPGLDAQGYDFALKLVARLLEGADACHITSPLLFEPATIAASMAILRPKAIDDAPVCGPEPSGGKSHRRHCGPGGRGAAVLWPDQAIRGHVTRAAPTALRKMRWRESSNPHKRPPASGEGKETLACRWASLKSRHLVTPCPDGVASRRTVTTPQCYRGTSTSRARLVMRR